MPTKVTSRPEYIFSECRQRSNWGPGQCFAPQMGSSVCEHQCGSWQGLRRGMGRLQWHMLQFKLSLDPCSSGGPAGAQCGSHYNQTQAGLVNASIMTPVLNPSNRSPPLIHISPALTRFYNRASME